MSNSLEDFVKTFPWVENSDIPWTQMQKPLEQCKVAMVSTGGIYVEGDQPFAIVTREDVDESYRSIPVETPLHSLRIGHEHYNKRYVDQDINVVFPVERFRDLEEEHFVGKLAEINFSISGYIPKPQNIYESGRLIAEDLERMDVDAVLVVPV